MTTPPSGAPDLGFLRRRQPARTAPRGPGRTPHLTLDGSPGARAGPGGGPDPAGRGTRPAPARPQASSPAHELPAPAVPDLAFLRRRRPAPRTAPPATQQPSTPPSTRQPSTPPAVQQRSPQPATRPSPQPATRQPAAPSPARTPAPTVPAPDRSVTGGGSTPAPSGRPALQGVQTLRPTAPSVTVPAEQATTGALRLHLTWSTLPTDPRSVQAGLKRSTDVHVGVVWELNDGTQGVVQSLGESFAAPGWGSTVLRLGPRSETDGETVTVALNQVHRLKRLVVFAYAYSGRPEWDALAVQLVVELRGGVEVHMGLDPAPPDATIAALASVHRVGRELVLRREAEYLPGQQSAVAEAYGWDLPWASGRTVPRRAR